MRGHCTVAGRDLEWDSGRTGLAGLAGARGSGDKCASSLSLAQGQVGGLTLLLSPLAVCSTHVAVSQVVGDCHTAPGESSQYFP